MQHAHQILQDTGFALLKYTPFDVIKNLDVIHSSND